jgi:hypothetical protein
MARTITIHSYIRNVRKERKRKMRDQGDIENRYEKKVREDLYIYTYVGITIRTKRTRENIRQNNEHRRENRAEL